MIYELIINRVRVKMLLDPAQITRIRVLPMTRFQKHTLITFFFLSFYARKGTNKKRRRKDRTIFFSVTFLLKHGEESGTPYPRFPLEPSLKMLERSTVSEKYAKRALCIITTLPGTH